MAGTRASFDVAVVGGGSAGIAAGVSAAALGARTLIVERSTLLGGNIARAYVHTICGLYRFASDGHPVHVHRGFPKHFAAALQRAGAAGEPERAGRVYVLPTFPPRVAEYAAAHCDATPSLTVTTERELVAARLSQTAGTPHTLSLRDKQGRETEVDATIAIDASGDATLGALAGAEITEEAPDTLQVPSYIFRLAAVETAEIEGFARLRLSHSVAGAVRSGQLPAGCESVLVRRGELPDEVYVTLGVARPEDGSYAPLDASCLADLESGARANAERVVEFLRRTRAGFEKCRMLAWPQCIGVRETRRLRGIVELGRDDILEGRSRDDEVALSSWPIELWDDHRRARFEYPVRPCSIPLGALISRSHPRLGLAGRCMSGSHEALGALRVIGTALATGQAIGVAAALAASAGAGLDAIAASDVRDHIDLLDERGLDERALDGQGPDERGDTA